MSTEPATIIPDPTGEKVFADDVRDAHARNLTDEQIAEFIDNPERCHPDNRLLLISTLAKRLYDERGSGNGSNHD